MLDTVTFDLWNTLISNQPQDFQKYRLQRVENLRGVLQRNGINASSDRLLDAYLKGFEKCQKTWDYAYRIVGHTLHSSTVPQRAPP